MIYFEFADQIFSLRLNVVKIRTFNTLNLKLREYREKNWNLESIEQPKAFASYEKEWERLLTCQITPEPPIIG